MKNATAGNAVALSTSDNSDLDNRALSEPAPLAQANTQPSLKRETFSTSRLLDFCSERELVKQIGHGVDQWPLVIFKELTDNALDACEEAGVAPVIDINVTGTEITITDNGPGIPAGTVAGILDFAVRVSSREAYASPTRGAQGNALKTIVAMAFALDGVKGETVIETQGVKHTITFKVDHVRQQPKIEHVRDDSPVRNGTKVTVHWPACACSKLGGARGAFLQMTADLGWLNPHLTLTASWNRELCVDFKATDPNWIKWYPHHPTSAHWYDVPRLRRLMGAYIARDQDHGREPRTVREFVSEFRGLSGSAKQKLVLEESGTARLSLPQFFGNADRVNNAGIAKLLDAMKRHSRPVNPKDLGFIGKDHLAARFAAVGGNPETFRYHRAVGLADGIPDVIESAFAWCPNGVNQRRIITGVNWSPAIGNPFRSLGSCGGSLDTILAEQRSGREEPIVFVLHVARPRIEYTDHGKTAVVIAGDDDDE
jgi:DNA topoisomerase VI subunit B